MNLINVCHHILIPHPRNNHRAKIIAHSGLVTLTLIAFLFRTGVTWTSRSFPQILGYASNISAETILELTNQQRITHGLPPLKANPQLTTAANDKAKHMFAHDYWAHITPTGEQPWAFISRAGYSYIYAGENLARDFADSQSVVTAWMNSPSHRDNILSPNYDHIGIAVVNGNLASTDTTLVIQEFGRPKQPQQVAQVTDQSAATGGAAAVTAIVSNNQVAAAQVSSTPTASPAVIAASDTDISKPGTIPAAKTTGNRAVYSPLDITKAWNIAIALLLVTVLAIDIISLNRKKIARISGRSLAHLLFIFSLISILALTNRGLIL